MDIRSQAGIREEAGIGLINGKLEISKGYSGRRNSGHFKLLRIPHGGIQVFIEFFFTGFQGQGSSCSIGTAMSGLTPCGDIPMDTS